MTIWFDGFDTYVGFDAIIGPAVRWATAGFGEYGAGLFNGTGQCLNRGYNPLTVQTPAVFSDATTVSCGFRMKLNYFSRYGAKKVLMTFKDSAGVSQCGVQLDGSGYLWAVRGITTAIGGASSIAMVPDTVNYIEVEAFIDATTGYIKVWLNGALVINETGANTKETGNVGSNIIWIEIDANESGHNAYLDDFYCRDDVRLGEQRVVQLVPTADTAQLDWTPSAGANYAAVDEETVDSDTTYVSGSVLGDYDLYDLANLPANTLTIAAVDVVIAARRTDTTTRSVRANLKSGVTTSNGNALNLSTSYQFATRDHYEVDPDTAVAWDEAGVNAMQIGPEITV